MSNAYGIDIGTSNFKMCCNDKDKILNEKNIIAIANKTELLAYGDEAYEMYEKAPEHIDVSFPVKFGVIADIENMLPNVKELCLLIAELRQPRFQCFLLEALL